jgi:hypothetical protein
MKRIVFKGSHHSASSFWGVVYRSLKVGTKSRQVKWFLSVVGNKHRKSLDANYYDCRWLFALFERAVGLRKPEVSCFNTVSVFFRVRKYSTRKFHFYLFWTRRSNCWMAGKGKTLDRKQMAHNGDVLTIYLFCDIIYTFVLRKIYSVLFMTLINIYIYCLVSV